MSTALAGRFCDWYRANTPAMQAPTTKVVEAALAQLDNNVARYQHIGDSRRGRPLFGVTLGTGALRISITAGAHADEPGGPLAALALARWLSEQRELLTRTKWCMCPHVNPDGAAANAAWFRDVPDAGEYLAQVVRELPGDDVEFNYPGSSRTRAPRPENIAVAAFLAARGPFQLHVSLHGMGFAEGAWWLIGKDRVAETAALRDSLRTHFGSLELGFHDIERRGEKGFHRISPGFATTPTSVAMREHFLANGDAETADLFLPSSMEFVQSLGGDPLVMVSEIPTFRLHGGGVLSDPPGDVTPYLRFRAALRSRPDADRAALLREFDVRPVSFMRQVQAIGGGVLLAVEELLKEHSA